MVGSWLKQCSTMAKGTWKKRLFKIPPW